MCHAAQRRRQDFDPPEPHHRFQAAPRLKRRRRLLASDLVRGGAHRREGSTVEPAFDVLAAAFRRQNSTLRRAAWPVRRDFGIGRCEPGREPRSLPNLLIRWSFVNDLICQFPIRPPRDRRFIRIGNLEGQGRVRTHKAFVGLPQPCARSVEGGTMTGPGRVRGLPRRCGRSELRNPGRLLASAKVAGKT